MKKLFLLILFLSLPQISLAHGLVTTLSQTSGKYIVEFEYDTIGNIRAGDFTTFGTYLLDQNRNPMDFDSVFMKISKENGAPVLVGNLNEASDIAGSARLSGIIYEGGNYISELEYQKDGKVIAKTNYKFQVTSGVGQVVGNAKSSQLYFLIGTASAIAGLIIGLLIKKKY